MGKTLKFKDLYIFFICIYLVSLPLGALSLGSLGSLLRYIALIPVAFALIGGRNLKISTPVMLFAAFAIYVFFTALWSIKISATITITIGQVMLLALVASGGMFKYTEEDIAKVKATLAWSSRFSALIMILFGEFVSDRFRLDGIITENPNYFCTYFSFGIIYALENLSAKKNFVKKILPMLELVVYIFLVLLTGSRGGLGSIAVGMVVFLVFSGKKGEKKVFLKFLLCIVFAAAFMFLIEQLPKELQFRFAIDEVVETGGTGRVEIWEAIFDVYNRSDLLRKIVGYGAGTTNDALHMFGYPPKDSHNAFINNLFTGGLMGFIFYAMFIFSFLRKAMIQENKFAFAVMFSIFVFTFGASAITLKPYFNIMLFIVLCMNVEKKEPALAENRI